MGGFEQSINNVEGQLEKGHNVTIDLKLMRHGERTKEGQLIDLGRKITRERATESGIEATDYDAIKAIGSNAKPLNEQGWGRSLETADIYADELKKISESPNDQVIQEFTTRAQGLLNFETIKSPMPYDHKAVYNTFLPENFETLPDDERVAAAKQAQKGVINHLLSLDTPEADAYRKEVAGSFAVLIKWYERVAKRLKDGSKVLLPAGTHGGTMELVLREALVHKNKAGEEVVGFDGIDEIGGDFSPSEAYNVKIATDEEGETQPFRVTFDNPARPQVEGMYLDRAKLDELAAFYEQLHSVK